MIDIEDSDVEGIKKIFGKLDISKTFSVGEIVYLLEDEKKEPVLILETAIIDDIMFCNILHGEQVYEGIPAPVLVYFKGLMRDGV